MSNEVGCAKLASPEREPQVVAQKEKLNRVLNELEGLVGDLHARLEKVLRTPEPSPPTEDCVENEIVPFAHEIRVQKRRVGSSNELIRDILNRIEL